ncbi:MAG: phosphate acyltransferase PlsX [Bacteroidota bacterium]
MQRKSEKKYNIAVDAMGGDFAPSNEIEGALLALNDKFGGDLEITLVGNEAKIRTAMKEKGADNPALTVFHTSESVTMDDDPTAALKRKRDSSLFKGIELVKNGNADGFISAGNTGAMLSTSTVLLGRIKGVSRPTIGSFMPTRHDRPTLVLDVGATIDIKSRFLYEFAVMGSIYSKQLLGIESPKIGLLNIGEEESKGTEEIKNTHKLLKESSLNFIGNVEGRDILMGTADVVVCDGFTGNIILKFAESFLGLLKSKIKAFSEKSLINKLLTAMTVPVLKQILKQFDYQEYGGVPLLGVNGNVIIGHGKSTPLAIKNMINRAVEMSQKELNRKIADALNPNNIENKIEKS